MTRKYRPSLTRPQLTHLLGLCKRDGSIPSLSIARILAVLDVKIEHSVVGPAYTLAPPRESLESSLGFAAQESPKVDISTILHMEVAAKRTEKSRLYDRWLESPQNLSVPELERVQEFRFEEDLMSESESQEYEAALFKLPQ